MHPTRILSTTGFRLAALYAGLFGLSVLILFGVIYWITDTALRQELMATIDTELTSLAADQQSGGVRRIGQVIAGRLAAGRHATTYYLLEDARGRKIAGNLPAMPAHGGWREEPLPAVSGDGRKGGRTEVPDDRAFRLLARGMILGGGSFLLVGENTYRIVEAKDAIFDAFLWAFGVTIVLGVAGGGLLSVGFLRRVDAINRTSQAIIEGRLADRVPTRGTGDELDRLAANLNEMLDRVQALMESLRQVSSDIAHDLRTPLSRLRQRLEGVRLQAKSTSDYRAAVDRAIADTDAILHTFSALLRITQIEAGTRKGSFLTVDLSALFQSIVDTYAAVAEDRGQVLSASVAPGITLRGDRELLTQMLVNIVENAIRHTPAGTHIRLELGHGPAGLVGMVADDGPGIQAEDRQKVFRRFYRLERSRSTPGSGLGLSLVAAVADLHGIHLSLVDNEPGLRVALEFPGTG